MRAWMIAGVLAAVTSPAAAQKCLSIPDAVAAQHKVEQANEANLAKELAAEKLVARKLKRHGPNPAHGPQTAYKMDAAITVDGIQVVFTGMEMPCGPIVDTEFVQQGTKVFRLVRQPRMGASHIEACDCYFPGYRCGGQARVSVAKLYELPPGTSYEGAMNVAYDAQDPNIRGGVASKTPCVPPPPPP